MDTFFKNTQSTATVKLSPVAYLLKKGIHINAVNNRYDNALGLAVQLATAPQALYAYMYGEGSSRSSALRENIIKCIKLLIENGSSLGEGLKTVANTAALGGDLEVLQLLEGYGVDMLHHNIFGSPLGFAKSVNKSMLTVSEVASLDATIAYLEAKGAPSMFCGQQR